MEYCEKVYYDSEPEQVKYETRPDGKADVWIRNNIHTETDQESGLIWVAKELHMQTVQTQAEIVANAINIFLTKSGIKKMLTDAVQAWMDETVQEKGYDNIFTACSYANSTNPKFKAEADACIEWRDRVWEYCYAALDNVVAGQREIPTVEELLAELRTECPFAWPEVDQVLNGVN